MKNRARGIDNGGIRIGFSSDKVAENVGGDHRACHTPFVKSRCIEIAEKIPVTQNGKVRKARLREMAEERQRKI